jgi:hypothetical protein
MIIKYDYKLELFSLITFLAKLENVESILWAVVFRLLCILELISDKHAKKYFNNARR